MCPPTSAPAAESAVPPAGAATLPVAVGRPDSPLRAIGLILAGTAMFAGCDIVAKMMTETVSAIEVAWYRNIVLCLLVVPTALVLRGPRVFRVPRPGLQVLRGIALVGSTVLFVLGLERLDVAEATAINFMSPIFITALSIPLLGEKVGARRWLAALVGLAGVLVVVRPGADAFTVAALLPMGSAAFWALGTVITRMMHASMPEATLAWTAVVGVSATTALAIGDLRMPSLDIVGLALLMGVMFTLANWLIILAFSRASASVLAPFSYVQILYAAVLSFLVLGEVPAVWTFVGGVLIAASGLYTAHRERMSRRSDLEDAGLSTTTKR